MREYAPSKKTKKYLELASRAAIQSNYPHFKHGAVLVKSASVISVAFNKKGYTSFGAKFRSVNRYHATLHAELASVLNVERRSTEGATVYVVRINKAGQFRLSKPCLMCEAALRYCGVKKVVYSTAEGFEILRL
jgi:deoxycytidylate deaminase